MRSKVMIVLLLATAMVGQSMAGELKDILAKHYEALGGMDVIKKMKTMKTEGKIVVSSPQGEFELPFTMVAKDGNKIKMETTFQGMAMVQASDGEVHWQINPMMGSTDPQDMSDEDSKSIKQMADFHGDLVDYEKKGYKLELAGKEDVEGTEAYKIIVTDGEDVRTYFLDTEYNLIIKSAATITRMGSTFDSETFPSGYKPVDGLMVAHSISQKSPMGDVVITMDKVEFNAEIDNGAFTKPAPAEPKTEGEEKK